MFSSSVKKQWHKGWYKGANHKVSPHANSRNGTSVDAIIIHNISLPQSCFATSFIDDLFLGCIDCSAHSSFNNLQDVKVSAHFLIRRDGQITQFVSADDRAWHAGVSSFQGRDNCNDFTVGIELEGTDTIAYAKAQYHSLSQLVNDLAAQYGIANDRIVGHCDIAPGRKTDPGESFDWPYFKQLIAL